MSWSVNAVGIASAVRESIRAQIERSKCAEPEETIKNYVGEGIDLALSAFPPNMAVRVAANGSQYAPDSKKASELQNQLKVEIEPMGVFLMPVVESVVAADS